MKPSTFKHRFCARQLDIVHNMNILGRKTTRQIFHAANLDIKNFTEQNATQTLVASFLKFYLRHKV